MEHLTAEAVEADLVALLDAVSQLSADGAEQLSELLPVVNWARMSRVRTFRDAGAMTTDRGVWIETLDGDEIALRVHVRPGW